MSESSSSDYRKAYEAAKRDLADLLAQEEQIERKKLTLRKNIELLAGICESEQIHVEPSAEAAYLIEHSSLADEIRAILKARRDWMRPYEIKGELERLGHDLSKYRNLQATVHMVLKRMAESPDVDEALSADGKQIYRCLGFTVTVAQPKRPSKTVIVKASRKK